MARELYQTEAVFRDAVDTCSSLVKSLIDVDLRDVLYPAGGPEAFAETEPKKLDLRAMLGRGGSQEDKARSPLRQTYLAQPATFVVEYALAQLWMSWGIVPDAMLGYSIGEYVAACLADVVSLSDAIRLVALRARLIQTLPEGAMLAVPQSERDVAHWLNDEVSLAAVNGASVCVLAGTPSAIDAIQTRLVSEGQPAVVRIQTTHAFHSKMMDPIAKEFEHMVRSCSLRAPRIPYVSNVSGTWITDAEATNPAYWTAHLCKPVRFFEGLRALWRDPARILLEVGPGRGLSTLALHNAPDDGRAYAALASMRSSYEGVSDKEVLLQTRDRLRLLDTPPSPAQDKRTKRKPRPHLFTPYAGPRDDREEELVQLWQDVLKMAVIGVHDNFFELGGHSLLAIFVIDQLAKRTQVKATLSLFFQHPTIAQFAKAFDALRTQETAAAEHSPPPPNATHDLQYVLPNGLEITHQNKAETDHFYEDIFEHRAYVRHLADLPENACVFDVGANIGLFTLFVHTLERHARVYSFEPSPPTFAILSKNVARHGVNAKIFDMGLSDREKTVDFTFYPRSSGMSSVYGNAEEEKAVLRAILENQMQGNTPSMDQVMAHSEELLEQRVQSQHFTCRLRTLSSVVREEGIRRIDLLKIDVQKSELDVLMGIAPGDWEKIRAIAIEVHDIEGRVEAIRHLLTAHAYDVEVVQDDLYRGSGIYLIYAKRSAVTSQVPLL